MENEPLNNTVKWPETSPLPSWYCPDCRISRIPPFLKRCHKCCDTETKQEEQARLCEENKDFYE